MKVDQAQIQELYAFTRQHFVEHYDLQTELVDHLCLGIEDQWKENPRLKFNEALNKEFQKFGVFGFQDVIGQRTKAMEKKYLAIIWRFFKEYITLPKIMFTLFLIALCYTLLLFLPSEISAEVVLGVYAIFLLFMLYKTFKFRKQLGSKERRWMLEDIISHQLGYLNIVSFPFSFYFGTLITDVESLREGWSLIMLSVGLPCLCLLLYIIIHIIPKRAEQLLEETYPEYRMV